MFGSNSRDVIFITFVHFSGISCQRPSSQLHDAQVLPGADQPVRQDLGQQTRGGGGKDEQAREWTRKIEIDRVTGWHFFIAVSKS